MNEKYHHRLRQLIKIKKNVILQGPPGVGKKYMLQNVWHILLIGVKAKILMQMIQFHQSYSYEVFSLWVLDQQKLGLSFIKERFIIFVKTSRRR